MEIINAHIHLNEIGNPGSEFTHVSQLCDEETAQAVGAALMLGCKLDELWAGNRHNTQQLIDMAAELTPTEGALAVEVALDGFESKLYMLGTSCGPLVVADDLIGVLCTRAVVNKILSRMPAPLPAYPPEAEDGPAPADT